MGQNADYTRALIDAYHNAQTPEEREEIKAEMARVLQALEGAKANQDAAAAQITEADELGVVGRTVRGAGHGFADLGSALGQTGALITGNEEKLAEHTQAIAERDARDRAILDTGAGQFGQAASILAPAAVPVGGISSLAGRLALRGGASAGGQLAARATAAGLTGGLEGYALTPGTEDPAREKAQGAAIGAAAGAAFPLVGAAYRGARDSFGDWNLPRATPERPPRSIEGQREYLSLLEGTRPSSILGDVNPVPSTRLLPAPQQTGRASGAPYLEGAERVKPRSISGGLIDEFNVRVTPAREDFMNTGNIERLTAERTLRRMPGDARARVLDDLAATRQDVGNALGDMPGGGGYTSALADDIRSNITEQADYLSEQAKRAWNDFAAFGDDMVFQPQQAKRVYNELIQTLRDSNQDWVDPLVRLDKFLRDQQAAGNALSAKGIRSLRRRIQNTALKPGEPGSPAVGAVRRRLDELLREMAGDDPAHLSLRQAIDQSANYLDFTQGTMYNAHAKTKTPTEIAKFITEMGKNNNTADTVIQRMLRTGGGARAQQFLGEIRNKLGPRYEAQAKNAMRRAMVHRMLRGDGSRILGDENYGTLANRITDFIRDNREAMSSIFSADELGKWERFAAMNRDLMTPSNADNWSGTAGIAEWLTRIPGARMLPGVDAISEFMGEHARGRMLNRVAYGE